MRDAVGTNHVCKFSFEVHGMMVESCVTERHRGADPSDCVICKIVAGTIFSWVVYQDAEVICFLPKTLQAYGHTVVASKAHYADLYTAPETILGHLISTAKKLAAHYNARIGASGVNLLHASGASAQQSVLHLHFHLIPRFDGDGLDTWPQLPVLYCDKDELLGKLLLHT